MNAVFEAAQYVDASDPTYTWIEYKPGEVRNMPILKAGNVAAPGEIVPRGFPAVLARTNDTAFKNGSGRLELADRLFTDTPALAARVMVNRVWDGTSAGDGRDSQRLRHRATSPRIRSADDPPRASSSTGGRSSG
jgi:hypothetical protein